MCKLHQEVALISTNFWHLNYLWQGKRTCEYPLALNVLFLTGFIARKTPTKQPQIRGSRKDKKRVVFLPVPMG